MGKTFKFVAAVLILLLIVGGTATLFVNHFLNTAPSEAEEVVTFEVKPGETLKGVARRLEEQGLVSSGRQLELYARFAKAPPVRMGEYALRRNMIPKELLEVITSGRSIEYPFTVSEGLNLFEIAELVEKAQVGSRDEFLELARDKDLIRELLGEELESLEGYLFPETYKITKYTGTRGLVKIMVNRFIENFEKVPRPAVRQMTRHQIVTLASIIEKETGAAEERPLISSVFHNRLTKGMRLQTDPTVIYGVWLRDGVWNKNITRNDLTTPHPYNTYTISGLPPGPIANPGFAALMAAVNPAQSEFLFFVSRNDGTHVFSSNYSQHKSAVTNFQLDRRAREGKSWRDLQKRQEKAGGSNKKAAQ